jgi:S-formylglutathione hydrolase FrmB
MNINKNFTVLIYSIVAVFIVLVIISRSGIINKDVNKKVKENNIKNHDTVVTGRLPLKDTVLEINKHKVFIKVPKIKKNGCFLLLHGWNLPAEDWCDKTSLCSKVLEKGFYIVLPDMGKSVYQENNYPETRYEWRIYPTRKWLSDTLIPELQKEYSLFLKTDKNYLVGLSTGARGVALLLLDLTELFKGAAALSGDYAQEKMPTDNLMTGFYGPFLKYKERWLKTDNPLSRVKEYKTPLYLGHGKLDQVVPPEQTKIFYDSLKKYHPELKIKLNMPDARHDYIYWDSEVDNILKFFKIE